MARIYRKKECVYCGKEKFIAAKGLCRACYGRDKRHGEPKYVKVKSLCTIEGCNREHVAQGYCELHYRRFIRHGVVDQTRPEDWGEKMQHPLYGSWSYLRRFKRGRTCNEWLDDFWQFYEDVGDRPSDLHKLVLIDKSGIYCKGNVKWQESAISLRSVEKLEYGRIYAKLHRAKNRDYYRNFYLKRNYGISLDEYNKMLDEQKGVCAICGMEETMVHPKHNSNGKAQLLAVDHCHVTNKVRGLLCSRCNRVIGMMRDSPELLTKAVEYLKIT